MQFSVKRQRVIPHYLVIEVTTISLHSQVASRKKSPAPDSQKQLPILPYNSVLPGEFPPIDKGIFPGSKGYILDFPGGGVGDHIFAHFYGQNKKIAEPGGLADPPDPPVDAPAYRFKEFRPGCGHGRRQRGNG